MASVLMGPGMDVLIDGLVASSGKNGDDSSSGIGFRKSDIFGAAAAEASERLHVGVNAFGGGGCARWLERVASLKRAECLRRDAMLNG